MSFITAKAISFAFIVTLNLFITGSNGITFEIQNNCAFTVWAAAYPGAGGKPLERGSSWTTDLNPGPNNPARIWGRTRCSFDGAGKGGCETGDCNGLLDCQSLGAPPYTVAEFLSGGNGMEVFDISLLEGFNVAMGIRGCQREVNCAADINGLCPQDLKAPGGCKNPCQVFNSPEYCGSGGGGSTQPTDLSGFFKEKCPDAVTYPDDTTRAAFTCPAGTRYTVVFCP